MKKIIAMALVLCMIFALSVTAHADDTIKIGMVTDVGGVNDQSFNQFAWAGLQNLAKEDPSFEVNYLSCRKHNNIRCIIRYIRERFGKTMHSFVFLTPYNKVYLSFP